MEGPRAPRAEEFPLVMKFLSSQLRQGTGWSIQDEYPLVLTPGNLPGFHIIEKDGRYLSGAVIKTSFVKSPAGLFKVAGIGSVVTDPEYRNQGLSRAILDSTLDAAKKEMCDIAILWSDLHDFYRKLGFELAGSETSVRIESEFPTTPSGLRFLESTKIAPDALARLYAQHTCGTIRSVEEVRKSLTIPNMRVYTAWDESNTLQAYAVEGKGADLAGHIHEWGGAVSKLLPLFNFIFTQQKKPITVMIPAHSRNMIRQLTGMGLKAHDGVLGMIKIITPDLLFAKLRRYARNQGMEDFIIEQRNGIAHFGIGANIYKTDSESDLVRLIFGPQRPTAIHSFDAEVGAAMDKLFPIPFWIWGWDSV